MTRLLALDAASEVCSAALLHDEKIIHRADRLAREHGPRLLTMTDELLAEGGMALKDLDAIVFGRGPGSFTGLRIAAGITQGLALAAGLPVIPVSDLAMLAQGAMEEEGARAVAVCLDARMGEAFVGFYAHGANGLAEALTDDALLKPENIALPDPGRDWVTVGDGWRAFDRMVNVLGLRVSESGVQRLPHARFAIGHALAAAGRGDMLDAAEALPVYLREKVAWQSSSP